MKKSELKALIRECVVEVRAEQKAKLDEGRKNGGKKPVAEAKKVVTKKPVVEQKKTAPKKVK